MMWGMGLVGHLVIVMLLLVAAALVQYLFSRRGHQNRLLRFYLRRSPFVSGPDRLTNNIR